MKLLPLLISFLFLYGNATAAPRTWLLKSNTAQQAPLANRRATWPSGADGALVIKSGETAQMVAGMLLDFSSVDIQSGGILEILPGSGWTIIGCAGDFNLRGTIKG